MQHPDSQYPRRSVLEDQGHVALVNHMGSDKSIVDAARVSYSKDSYLADIGGSEISEKDIKLITYLMKNKHTSPLESVQFSFEVEAPIFIFRQWHRHRTWSYNEVSARYTELPDKFYLPSVDTVGKQHTSNKQMRVITDLTVEERLSIQENLVDYSVVCAATYDMYQRMIKGGFPRELARMVLPVSTFSRMVATVDLHNLMHFLRLRLHEHAQWEIQQYAVAITYLILPVVPVVTKAFLADLVTQPGYEHLMELDLTF